MNPILRRTVSIFSAFVIATVLFLLVPVMQILLFHPPTRDRNADEVIHELEMLVKPKQKVQEERKIRQIKNELPMKSSRPSNSRSLNFDLGLATGSAEGVSVSAGGSGNIVFEVADVDEPVRMLSEGDPRYPRRAREEGVSGLVDAVWVVTATGAVRNFEIIREEPEGFGFAQAVRAEVPRWKFSVAKKKNVPVSQRVRKRFNFNLD